MDSTSPATNSAGLSTREIQLLGLAWQCFKTQPEIDIQRLAQLGGYTHPGSARNALSKAKSKIFAAAETVSVSDSTANDDPTSSAGKTKAAKAKAAGGRKRKQTMGTDDNDDNAGQSADKNAKRSKPKSGAKKAKKEEDLEEEEFGVHIKED